MNRRDTFTILYICLIIIVLTFFIFLTVNSTISPEKKKKAIGSLIGSFGIFTSGLEPMGEENIRKIGLSVIDIGGSEKIRKAILRIINALKIENFISVKNVKGNLLFKIKKGLAFKKGTDKFNRKFYVFLIRTYNLISSAEIEKIHIKAFGEKNYLKNFLSPYDLSAHRAFKVAKFFIDKGIDKKVIVASGGGLSNNYSLILNIAGKVKEGSGSKRLMINLRGFSFEVK